MQSGTPRAHPDEINRYAGYIVPIMVRVDGRDFE